ncbi:MAG: UDP-N-acetylmuramoyl-L-alanyl-D-glutamate--2,6-diaminopimelate ligase [Rickettsiales bacterium]|nr:UDP-N-acetylmuramoyl-L-alanyl-D-glutamate--2,6-diaminopimelate ligase [Rickettsiales bacterium]
MLSALEARLSPLARRGPLDVDIRAATADSRQVRAGSIFAAIDGSTTDGHRFIAEALKRGAAAVLLSRWPAAWPDQVVGLQVQDPRRALALVSSALCGDPAESMRVIAVTGTNGKTSTVAILRSIFAAAGLRGGSLGTTGISWQGLNGAQDHQATHTTPEGPTFYRWLGRMAEDGVEAVALELSSHALHQGRTAGLQLDVAGWSNLSRDHLDYHGDLLSYERAKALLLTEWLPSWGTEAATAVLNVDDPVVAAHGQDWHRTLRVSAQPGAVAAGRADLAPVAEPVLDLDGLRVSLADRTERLQLSSPLLGRHNLANCLLAAGCALAAGIKRRSVEQGIAAAVGARGRLEAVRREDGRGPLILVDYAHSPAAISETLQALRSLNPDRLVIVCGCGGERDQGKRPLMARAAAEGADFVWLTSDNPRGEDPEAILDAMEQGLKGSSAQYCRVVDRASAIREAIISSREGEVVLIAGKGHESYQEIDGVQHPFDDREQALRVLEASP